MGRQQDILIGGKMFSLFSSHKTKALAQKAAARDRKLLGLLVRVRKAPKGQKKRWDVFARRRR